MDSADKENPKYFNNILAGIRKKNKSWTAICVVLYPTTYIQYELCSLIKLCCLITEIYTHSYTPFLLSEVINLVTDSNNLWCLLIEVP